MDIHLTPGHVLYIMSGIMFGTSALFHVALYLGRFYGRLESVEKAVKQLQTDVTELRTGV